LAEPFPIEVTEALTCDVHINVAEMLQDTKAAPKGGFVNL